jgi:tetratricopeptide (TPR) repeat protein
MNLPHLFVRPAALAAAVVVVLSVTAAAAAAAAEALVEEVVGTVQLHRADELSKMGRRIEAEKEFAEVAAQRARILGVDHPATLRAEGQLWDERMRMREKHMIPTEFRDLIERMTRVLGPDHADTLAARNALAGALMDDERFTEAGGLMREIVAALERVSGPEDKYTLRARELLAQIWGRQAEKEASRLGHGLEAATLFTKAERELREVLTIRLRISGADDADTLSVQFNAATILFRQRRFAEAEPEYRKVLEARAHVLAAGHRDTFLAAYQLALCLQFEGKDEEALQFATRAENGFTNILGANDQNAQLATKVRQFIERKIALTKQKAR